MKKYLIPIVIAVLVPLVVIGYDTGIFMLDGQSNNMRLLKPKLSDNGYALFVDFSKPSHVDFRPVPQTPTNPVSILLMPSSTLLQNMVATNTEVNVGFRTQYNFINASFARLVAVVQTAGTGTIGLQIAPASQWFWIDGNLDSTTGTQPNTILLNQTGLQQTAWFPLPAQATQDVSIRVITEGGDGVQDPRVANLRLQVR